MTRQFDALAGAPVSVTLASCLSRAKPREAEPNGILRAVSVLPALSDLAKGAESKGRLFSLLPLHDRPPGLFSFSLARAPAPGQ